MNYSGEGCQSEFTQGQIDRIDEMWEKYREQKPNVQVQDGPIQPGEVAVDPSSDQGVDPNTGVAEQE